MGLLLCDHLLVAVSIQTAEYAYACLGGPSQPNRQAKMHKLVQVDKATVCVKGVRDGVEELRSRGVE